MPKDSKDSTNRALILAGQVLRREVSLDQGLVLANSEGLLKSFIADLNVLSNREVFRLVEAEDRVKSGKADLALKGQIPLWDLPVGLSEQHQHAVPFSTGTSARLIELERELAKVKEAAGDLEAEIRFLEAVRLGLKPPSNPWGVAAILMVFSLIIAGMILSLNGSVIAAAGVLLFFTLVSVMIAVKESARYTVEWKKTHEEDKRIREKMSSQFESMTEFDRRIRDLETEATNALAGLDDSERRKIQLMHPVLFDPAKRSK